MPFFTDQTGRLISLHSVPQRIVSLVPSQTELLYDLGLENEVTGITKFCVHPEKWFRNKTRVGGTKTVSMDVIDRLQPDLIIANKEENVKEQVESLSRHYPVWVSDVNNLEDACSMIGSIGSMVNRTEQAQNMIVRIRQGFEELRLSIKPGIKPIRTAYFIWKDPYMTVGGDTFIHDMLTRCGFENIFAAQTRYPSISLPQLNQESTDEQTAPQKPLRTSQKSSQARQEFFPTSNSTEILTAQLILLSSEPYPFKQKHADELQQQLPSAKVLLADGEMFSWYGSRLLQAGEYFRVLRERL